MRNSSIEKSICVDLMDSVPVDDSSNMGPILAGWAWKCGMRGEEGAAHCAVHDISAVIFMHEDAVKLQAIYTITKESANE